VEKKKGKTSCSTHVLGRWGSPGGKGLAVPCHVGGKENREKRKKRKAAARMAVPASLHEEKEGGGLGGGGGKRGKGVHCLTHPERD